MEVPAYLIENKGQPKPQGNSQAALFSNGQKNDNQIESVQVWYRLFKYTRGEHYGENQLRLGRGYFIDLYVGTIPGLVVSLEKLQNRSRPLDLKLAQLRFYQRWFDPVIRLPLLLWLPCLRGHLKRLRRNAPTEQISRRVHPQRSTNNQ